jgi:hypothetical protein
MPSSGTVTFSVSRDDIIQNAMKIIGELAPSESPTAAETTDCSMFLNMMVKQWQGQADFAPGLKMWSRKRGNLFLSTSTNSYSLGPAGHWSSSVNTTTLTAAAALSATALTVASITGISSGDNIGIVLTSGDVFWTTVNGAPSGVTVNITTGLSGAAASGNTLFTYATANQGRRPLQILTAVLRDSTNQDTPLSIMTLEDYQGLPAKADSTTTGDPSQIYYESQLTNGILYTDIFPSNTTKYIHTVYLSPIEDFNASTDTPDYPQQWYRALSYGLAVDISPLFQFAVRPDIKMLRDEALIVARNQDPEVTHGYYQPNVDYTDYGPIT